MTGYQVVLDGEVFDFSQVWQAMNFAAKGLSQGLKGKLELELIEKGSVTHGQWVIREKPRLLEIEFDLIRRNNFEAIIEVWVPQLPIQGIYKVEASRYLLGEVEGLLVKLQIIGCCDERVDRAIVANFAPYVAAVAIYQEDLGYAIVSSCHPDHLVGDLV